ncbi:unnamed protein product, partial [Rangifer tarandus platyrhynchus]
MGEAEREPSTSERDTEKPEVERRARGARRKDPKETGNTRGESAEENTVAGSCRGVPETTERDPKRIPSDGDPDCFQVLPPQIM